MIFIDNSLFILEIFCTLELHTLTFDNIYGMIHLVRTQNFLKN